MNEFKINKIKDKIYVPILCFILSVVIIFSNKALEAHSTLSTFAPAIQVLGVGLASIGCVLGTIQQRRLSITLNAMIMVYYTFFR